MIKAKSLGKHHLCISQQWNKNYHLNIILIMQPFNALLMDGHGMLQMWGNCYLILKILNLMMRKNPYLQYGGARYYTWDEISGEFLNPLAQHREEEKGLPSLIQIIPEAGVELPLAPSGGKHRSARVTRPNVSMQEEMFLRIAFCLVSLSVVHFQNQEVNVAMLSSVMMCENDRVLPVQVFAAMCGCLREWIVKCLGGCAWASAYRFTSVTSLFVGSPSFGLLCPKEHAEGKLLRNDQVQIAFIVKMRNGTHANPVTSLDQRSKR